MNVKKDASLEENGSSLRQESKSNTESKYSGIKASLNEDAVRNPIHAIPADGNPSSGKGVPAANSEHKSGHRLGGNTSSRRSCLLDLFPHGKK
mmetsp:Transcript_6693/g.16381  ORF Transcript_6693/g.16381 Transcript_6693/m.16381 type:complete len:93 (+) Transcript_6693:88-366(+)